MGVIEVFRDAERRFPLPSEWGRQVGGCRAWPLSLCDSRSSFAGGESLWRSGWRSCAAAQQLPELAARERWAGKLSSAFLPTCSGWISAWHTASEVRACPAPWCCSPLQDSPGLTASPSAPFPAAGTAGCAVLWRLRRVPRLLHSRVAPTPRIPGLGRVAWIGRRGAKDPWSGVRGEWLPQWAACYSELGQTSPRLPSLFTAGRAGHFPLSAWQRLWEVCCGFALSCPCRGCGRGTRALRGAALPAGRTLRVLAVWALWSPAAWCPRKECVPGNLLATLPSLFWRLL